MNTVAKVMAELKKKGNPLRIQAFAPHGAPQDLFGVSVADMKVIARRIKGEQQLACELYETGNGDAMYLAGMVADGALMTKKQLDSWAKTSSWQLISEYAVPGVATESKHAHDLAIRWIKSKKGIDCFHRLEYVCRDCHRDVGRRFGPGRNTATVPVTRGLSAR